LTIYDQLSTFIIVSTEHTKPLCATNMNLISKTLNIITLLTYGFSLLISLISEFSIYETAIPALSLDLIITVVYLSILLRKEKANDIVLFCSQPSSSSVMWFYLILFIAFLVCLFFDPMDIKGWVWLGLTSSRLIKELFPKLNWELMIANNRLVFPIFWKKSIKLSEIDNIDYFEDRLEIKSNKKTTKIRLSKNIMESIRLKIQSA